LKTLKFLEGKTEVLTSYPQIQESQMLHFHLLKRGMFGQKHGST